ncbi:MAG: hypothetical protein GY769_23835 [bacterium]|nr:hypothetical protein [bacterium]
MSVAGLRRALGEPAPLKILAITNSAAAALLITPYASYPGRRLQLAVFSLALLGAALATLRLFARKRGIATFRLVQGRGWVADVAMLLLGFIAVLALINGLLRGHELHLVLGDSGKLLLTVLLYTLARNALSSTDDVLRLTLLLIVLLSFQQLRDAFAAGDLFLGRSSVLRLSSLFWCQNLAAFTGLFLLALKARGVRLAGLSLAIGAVVLTGAASAYRAYVLLIAFVAAVPLVLDRRQTWRGYLRLGGIATAALIGLAILLAALGVDPSVLAKPAKTTIARFEATFKPPPPGPRLVSKQREAELAAVVEAMRGDNLGFVVGKGSGATFQLSAETNPDAVHRHAKDSYRAHHLHNSMVSFFFRYGLLGLAVFTALSVWGFYAAARYLLSSRQPVLWWAPLVTISYLLASQFFLLIPGDFVFATAFAIIARRPEPLD